jgi:hypothetical protein
LFCEDGETRDVVRIGGSRVTRRTKKTTKRVPLEWDKPSSSIGPRTRIAASDRKGLGWTPASDSLPGVPARSGGRHFTRSTNRMIHFTCDCCQRPLSKDEVRYVVRFEVYPAFDAEAAIDPEVEADRDHLDEIQDTLRHFTENEDLIDREVYESRRYDLCGECRKRFLNNPLRIDSVEEFQFSQN